MMHGQANIRFTKKELIGLDKLDADTLTFFWGTTFGKLVPFKQKPDYVKYAKYECN